MGNGWLFNKQSNTNNKNAIKDWKLTRRSAHQSAHRAQSLYFQLHRRNYPPVREHHGFNLPIEDQGRSAGGRYRKVLQRAHLGREEESPARVPNVRNAVLPCHFGKVHWHQPHRHIEKQYYLVRQLRVGRTGSRTVNRPAVPALPAHQHPQARTAQAAQRRYRVVHRQLYEVLPQIIQSGVAQ